MCGIAGYVGFDNQPLLKEMIRTLRHRGPDDTGFYVDQKVGLGNARLSIIDIEGGHQPIQNEDGTVHVTHNGEIYNFQELRRQLETEGHKFRTRSDTETIVHAYEQYGEAFAEKLNGMFAIAIWDAVKRRLLLARDRIGIKPLYYTPANGGLIFASEIKAILQAPLERRVNREALNAILNLGYIPGGMTMIANVNKLQPSTLLVYENGSTRQAKYWDLPRPSEALDEEAIIQQLRSALADAVRDQLVADVPVGCFLSGGLDTSTIVAYATQALNVPLKTFCMGFGEETDEFLDARLIAEHFGTDHHELTVDSSQAMRLYPRMIWHMEAPKYNLYPWFVCELVRKHVTVCLSGNGGDELFGGYLTRYRNAMRIDSLGRNPLAPMLRATGRILTILPLGGLTASRARTLTELGNKAHEYLILAGALPDSVNRELSGTGGEGDRGLSRYFSEFFGGGDFLQELMHAELRTKLVDDLLSVDDSMSMAHSLELRVPLLDNRIVDLMLTLPWNMKYRPGTDGKLLLRKAVQDVLPKASLRKPKWGFTVNVSAWFKGELGELVRQVVPDSEVLARYFPQNFLKNALQKRLPLRERRRQVLLWQLLGFHFWHRIFIDTDKVGSTSFELDALVA